MITITPIVDHKEYNVNGHTVYKDQNDKWISPSEMTFTEVQAFKRYKTLIIDNPRFKKHTKATYK